MTIPARLDRFIRATRLDLLSPEGRHRSRNLRWLPLPILLALPLGYALLAAPLGEVEGVPRAPLAGALIFFAAFVASSLIRFIGPRLAPGADRPLDERELVLEARAGSVSGSIIVLLTVLGCFYCAGASVYDWWRPRGTAEWVFLGLAIQGYAFALPVLVASWFQPRAEEDE
jgi:hypothetical protein